MNQNNLKKEINIPLLSIVKYGDTILREKVKDIYDFSQLPVLVEQMFATMSNENGIGLAANQVGWKINLLVINTYHSEQDDINKSHVLINSRIISSHGESVMEEGCLSVPEIRAKIKRPDRITVQYQDLDSDFHEKSFSGLISRVIQHEMDHLNGKLFIDYLSQTKRILINKRLLEISKSGSPSTGIIL